MQVNIIVCDVCGDPRREVTTYRISKGSEPPVKRELCGLHARPVETLLRQGDETPPVPTPAPVKRAATRRAVSHKKVTMAEIEAQKKGK